MTERSAEQASKEQLREYRRVVAAAVGELRSNEIRNSFAALSFEELIDQHIDRMTGTTDANHPSRLSRITKVRDDLAANIEGIKATPPAAFTRSSSGDNANTPVEGESTS